MPGRDPTGVFDLLFNQCFEEHEAEAASLKDV